MTAFAALVHGPVMGRIVDRLATTMRVVKLYEQADPAAYLKQHGAEFQALVGGFKGKIDAAVMDQMPNLKIISNFGVGYDSVDAAEAGKRGVTVTNTPDVLNDEVADTAMGLLLMTVRRLPQSERYLRAGKWEKEGSFPLSSSLVGRTMGIVGLGRIGKAIAKRAEAFGLKIAYFGRSKQADVPYTYYSDLTAMARDVTILMVIVPGGAGTRHLINRQVLEALGSNGYLINVARGTVVDEPALIDALKNNVIAAAGLDVFEAEPKVPQALIDLDNAVLLPHVGSGSIETRDAMADLVSGNVLAIAAGKPPMTPVAETPWKG